MYIMIDINSQSVNTSVLPVVENATSTAATSNFWRVALLLFSLLLEALIVKMNPVSSVFSSISRASSYWKQGVLCVFWRQH